MRGMAVLDKSNNPNRNQYQTNKMKQIYSNGG